MPVTRKKPSNLEGATNAVIAVVMLTVIIGVSWYQLRPAHMANGIAECRALYAAARSHEDTLAIDTVWQGLRGIDRRNPPKQRGTLQCGELRTGRQQ